jgi:hypothetical protein
MTMRSRRLFVAFLFAGLWVAVAGLRPDTTFHLAPLIVAAWPALPERELAGAIRMSLLGLFLAAATTMMMFRLGWLDGPSLLPWGGAGLDTGGRSRRASGGLSRCVGWAQGYEDMRVSSPRHSAKPGRPGGVE